MDLRGQIHIHLIQQTLNAVEHAVYFVESSLLRRLIDPCQAGINNRGRSP